MVLCDSPGTGIPVLDNAEKLLTVGGEEKQIGEEVL
jgi:hypothetical protein